MQCVTAIDWAATGTMLQGVGTVAGALAVVAAGIIGSRTFDRWRRQTLAERHIQQAERILTATYKARRDIAMVRSPVMWAYELEAGEARLKELGQWDGIGCDESERRRFRSTQAYYNRLASIKDDRVALEECQPMARAFFGADLEGALEKLNHQFDVFRVYVDANHNDKAGADAEFRKKIDSAIWTGYPSSELNEIDQVIAEQVRIIEKTCVPVLRLHDLAKAEPARGSA